MSTLTPEQFVRDWQGTTLSERATYQAHFIALCHMLGHPPPTGSGVDAQGKIFTFEYSLKKETGGQGFADVFYEDHFAIEYKAPGKYKDLGEAHRQLQQYRENLKNPPLLIVTDIENWEIHTNFTNAANKTYAFTHDQISQPLTLRYLRNCFDDPNQLHPNRTTEQVTADAALGFQKVADSMRSWQAEPERIAHFLTKLVFCLFAEDTGLLPVTRSGDGIFTEIVTVSRERPSKFKGYLEQLFRAMAEGGELLMEDIDWFNGSLFEDVTVEELPHEALVELEHACRLDWANVEPAIFGTLFERSLDPAKRAQLGAHYTSRDDILLIVEPVLMQPLRREWQRIRTAAEEVRAKFDAASTGRAQSTHRNTLESLREEMLAQLREVTVLDPACGSGNFLYVSLGLLLDLEKAVITDPVWADTGLKEAERGVHPRQLYGIEINPIAHALTSIVVWIGYIQWQKDNGYIDTRQPILEDLHENMRLMDAIMRRENGQLSEPDWPAVDVIVGNPPFLGNRRMRPELGDEYVDNLLKAYSNSFGNLTPDLVCYWHEKARSHLENGKVKRVGLLATNSIRGGTNRTVLERIDQTGRIFHAWSDREWVLDGAAVRVSMVCFDDGSEQEIVLDGIPVEKINPDLTAETDITSAHTLDEIQGISFQGVNKRGPFDIPASLAKQMIETPNADTSIHNKDVIKPIWNGLDVTRRPRNVWIIDFGVDTPLETAQRYSEPFSYLEQHVKPMRAQTKQKASQEIWWLHWNPRPEMREALEPLARYIATARVAKHRLFVWLEKDILPDVQLIAIAREDDYFFGVLHSRLHEVWSLRMGTSLEDRPRYTPTTTFETFPFPWSPGSEDTESAAYRAIRDAARQLHEERDAWLNPVDTVNVRLQDRTLTNLYNALVALREMGGKTRDMPDGIKVDAWEFAPRLMELHDALDRAVCDAYGWPYAVLDDEEEILRRLLALNLQRAGV